MDRSNEQLRLLRLAQNGDTAAKEQLIRDNQALVWSIVKRYTGRGTEAEDLFQLGSIGLLKAIEGFDCTYGTRFSTYAVPKISGEIRRFLRDDGAMKVSRSVKELGYRVHTAREQMLGEACMEERVVESLALREAMERLDVRSQHILLLRYFRGQTQQACARQLGISQVQVSRLEKKAVQQLRKWLAQE